MGPWELGFKLNTLELRSKTERLRDATLKVGVVCDELAAEEGAVEVEVDFGGGDGFVAEQFLDGAKVGAPLKEMGGE